MVRLPRGRTRRVDDRSWLRTLDRLLTGKLRVHSVPEPLLVSLSCGGLLDDLMGKAKSKRTAERLRARYEVVFKQTVIGVYEDRLDGRRVNNPKGFFTGVQGQANGAILTRHLIEDLLELAPEDAPRLLQQRCFVEHRLDTMLAVVFGSSPSAAVEATYPGRYRPWEFTRSPQHIWQGERGRKNAIAATRWLFGEKLGWPVTTIARRCTQQTFEQNGLSGMLQKVYKSSPFAALEAAYPGRFHPWDLSHVAPDYWTGPDGRAHSVAALRWLIEERLGLSENEVRTRLSRATFREHRLDGMMNARYGYSLAAAIEEAYPGRYRPWELRRAPQAFWRSRNARRNAAEATRWLVEERLGWNETQVKLLLCWRDFADNDLRGMLKKVYRYSGWRALEDAYPGRYRPEDLYAFGRPGGHRDRVTITVIRRLRLLADGRRLGVAAACRRNQFSRKQYEAFRHVFAAHGVDGLVPKARGRIYTLTEQREVLRFTERRPAATAKEVSRALAAGAVRLAAADVERIWRRHRLMAARERYQCRLRAETAEGVTLAELRRERVYTSEAEAAVLAAVEANPGMGRSGVVAAVRARGFPVTDDVVKEIFTHYGLGSATARVAACGGLRKELRKLAKDFVLPS